MKLLSSIGTLLLSIWLVVTGLVALLGIGNKTVLHILPILAVAAGVLLLIENRSSLGKGLGMVVLAIWLILTGLRPLVGFHFSGEGVVLGIMAVVAGALLILQR